MADQRVKQFLLGMSALEFEREILSWKQAGRQICLLTLKRLKREPGAARRLRDWRRSLEQDFEQMRRAHDAGHPLAAYDALACASAAEMMPPRWAVDALLAEARRRARGEGPRKKTGRHARAGQAQRDRLRDWLCHELVKDLCHRGSSKRQACEDVGRRFERSPEAIRAAFRRAEDRKDPYFSELAASTALDLTINSARL